MTALPPAQASPPVPAREGLRVNGLVVLVGIVVVGLVTGAGFYRMKRSEANAQVAADLAQAPKTPEERLALWLRLSGPQLHHRLAVVGRFSTAMPWLVTHAVAVEGGPPEVWGVDCATIPKDFAHIEGMTIVVELPVPRLLAHAPIDGDGQDRVPLFAPEAVPDARARLTALALHLLEGIPAALERDVEGAHLEIRVAGAD